MPSQLSRYEIRHFRRGVCSADQVPEYVGDQKIRTPEGPLLLCRCHHAIESFATAQIHHPPGTPAGSADVPDDAAAWTRGRADDFLDRSPARPCHSGRPGAVSPLALVAAEESPALPARC